MPISWVDLGKDWMMEKERFIKDATQAMMDDLYMALSHQERDKKTYCVNPNDYGLSWEEAKEILIKYFKENPSQFIYTFANSESSTHIES